MRANLLITTCVGVLCTTVVRLDQPAHAVQDGFENIAVGDYPGENGWNILFSGKDARVTDACAHSGTRSFCLNSYPDWAHMDYLYLDQIPDRLTYEVSICVDPTNGSSALAGFMKGVANEGPVWNYFWVSGATRQVYFYDTYVGQYTPGTWCTLRADLDFVNLKGDLWMNGSLVVEDVAIKPREFDTDRYGHVVLNQWGVMSCNYSGGSDNVVYFDDVRLYEMGEVPIDIKPGSSPNPNIEPPSSPNPNSITIGFGDDQAENPASSDIKPGSSPNPNIKPRSSPDPIDQIQAQHWASSDIKPGSSPNPINIAFGDNQAENPASTHYLPELLRATPTLPVTIPVMTLVRISFTPLMPTSQDEVVMTITGWKQVSSHVADHMEVRTEGREIFVDIYWISGPLPPNPWVLKNYEITRSLGAFAPGTYAVHVTNRGVMGGDTSASFTVRDRSRFIELDSSFWPYWLLPSR